MKPAKIAAGVVLALAPLTVVLAQPAPAPAAPAAGTAAAAAAPAAAAVGTSTIMTALAGLGTIIAGATIANELSNDSRRPASP